MKKILLVSIVCAVNHIVGAQTSTNNYVWNAGTIIPDGNPVGLMGTFAVNNVNGVISKVTMSMDITGGFNGDLYAYLVSPQGSMSILLNRVGLTALNPVGYADAGLNITMDDSGYNIHNYQDTSYTIASGQLTGIWAPDGRNIDPQSAGGAFDTASTAANLSLFNDQSANGTWTIFVSDLSSGGGSAVLNSIGLTIMAVPEPSILALAFTGGLVLFFTMKRKVS